MIGLLCRFEGVFYRREDGGVMGSFGRDRIYGEIWVFGDFKGRSGDLGGALYEPSL